MIRVLLSKLSLVINLVINELDHNKKFRGSDRKQEFYATIATFLEFEVVDRLEVLINK